MNFKIYGIKEPVKEYKFHPDRKWRFDYCWPDKKVAIEVEGGIWIQGRHNRGSGFLKDLEKYNSAASLKWFVFRFTPQQMQKGEFLKFVEHLL